MKTTFEELMEVIKDFCNAKDKQIQGLKNEIENREKERSLIRQRFLEKRYDLLETYFNQEV